MDQQSEVFRPIGARYLVLPDEVKGQGTTAGEYTIDVDRDPTKKSESGVIVSMGKACTEPLKPGDRVCFGKYSGYTKTVDGVEHKILQETELLGEIVTTPFDQQEINTFVESAK